MQVITNKEIISSFGNLRAGETIEIPDRLAIEWIHAELVREVPASYPEREKKVIQPTEKKRGKSAKQ